MSGMVHLSLVLCIFFSTRETLASHVKEVGERSHVKERQRVGQEDKGGKGDTRRSTRKERVERVRGASQTQSASRSILSNYCDIDRAESMRL